MKKNKKQLKREKKNLRRQKEMMIIQKLTEKSIKNSTAENIEVADWGIDQYGNSTHRINEKGAIDSSVTEMFGCELERSILKRGIHKLLDDYDELTKDYTDILNNIFHNY